MDYSPNIIPLFATVVVVGISFYLFSKWMSSGVRCLSKARLKGKTVIITGGNSGIGKETARDLAKRGARVILACRSLARAKAAAEDLARESNLYVVIAQCDLTSFKSIRHFVNQVHTMEATVDILINNAGIICAKSTTEDDIDTQFCTNHLGHFLLTHLLMDKLKSSAPSRIINVSSRFHKGGKMDWDDLNMEKPGSYNAMFMYCRSKLANVLFTKELARRLKGTGVNSYCVHPGMVFTDFQNNLPQKSIPAIIALPVRFARKYLSFLWKSAELGAQTSIYCAVAKELEKESGLYYSDCAVATPSSQALNEESAKKLWDVSLKMAGIVE